jgi:N-methylhydantoinase B
VVFDAAQGIDAAATNALRQRLRQTRLGLDAYLTSEVFETGAVSRRRVWRLNPNDAALAHVGEDDVVELDSGRAAPLRGWARLDASLRRGTVSIDARGLAILKAAEGEKLTLRRVRAAVASDLAIASRRE